MSQVSKQSSSGRRAGVAPLAHDRPALTHRVTLDDIARASGLSIATVSRALGGSPRVAAPTREKIEKVAEQLGYRANVAASLLASARPQILGLVCSLQQELHVRYRAEALRYAEDRGFRVIVESIDASRDVDRAWESVLQLRAQAVIAVGSTCISTRFTNTPTVLIGQRAPRRDIDLVTSANERGMGQAIALLVRRGSRRIAFLEGPPGPSARARKAAFTQACRAHGVDALTVAGGDNIDAGFLAIRAGVPAGVDALVCYNDQCAHGAILALLGDGLIPGRDILVVGCDNSAIASSRALSLTSIDRAPARVASLAVEQAIARALGDDDRPSRRSVDTELFVRASTG